MFGLEKVVLGIRLMGRGEKAMTQDESQQIEELLVEWYCWQSRWSPALGHGRVDPSCRGFQDSKQWMSQDERRELEERKAVLCRVQQVDACVDSLHDWRHRAAIQISMKNKASNAAVFRSPRLCGQDHALYQEAKEILFPVLLTRGLVRNSRAGCNCVL